VRPVNLLPERHRPRTATGDRQGSSYILLGVLGGVLVAALIYVLTLNQINSRRDAVTQAKADTQQANARIQSLSAYGNFVQVKNARVQAVKQLAEGRFDWELTMRELARVLPAHVWLLSADATDGTGEAAGSGSGTSSSAPASTPAASNSGGSSTPGTDTSGKLSLTGCAGSQHEVAVTLVRLRQMNGVSDVSLKQSTATKADGGAAACDSSSGGAGACSSGEYQFQADLALTKPDSGSAPGKVPASLGGGS
jgi:Tfp pilus assembly protein PilN